MKPHPARIDSRPPVFFATAVRGLTWLLLLAPASPALGVDRAALLSLCPDADSDGFAACSGGCDATGLVCGDCDDAVPAIHPGAAEACNHRDDDCDGLADEGSTRRLTAVTYYDPDPQMDGSFGADATAFGDVDGDGVTDLAVTRTSGLGVRGLELLSGADRRLLCMMVAMEPRGPEGTGGQVAGIGDVNGDGVPDVAATASDTQWNDMGEVGSLSIFSGSDCSFLRKCIDPIGQTGDRLGAGFGADGRLDSFRDLDGDGIPEVAAGAPAHYSSEGSGEVLFFSPLDCNVVARIWPPDPLAGGWFGHSLATIPDLTGDGIVDLVVGEPYWHDGRGSVLVYSGADLSLVRRISDAPGNRTDDLLGFVVDGTNDVSGDGVHDIVASALGDDQYRGSVMIYSGATGEFVRKMFDPAGTDDEQLGRVVAAADDMTGDGFPDILAGWLPDGSVIVFDSRNGSVARRFYDPDGVPLGFGSIVIPDADLSRDGEQDLIVFNPLASLPGNPSLANVGNLVVFIDDSDCDGDGGTLYEGDCADGGALALPGEAADLRVADDSVTLTWAPPHDPRGTNALLYDVLRASIPSSFASAVCLETDSADQAATDAASPALGKAFFYQIRAQNPCGEGSLGFASNRLPRAAAPSCP